MIELNKIYHGDAYKLIKEIPDKSVDLIYTDIPYKIESGGTGPSAISQRINKEQLELGKESARRNLLKRLDEYRQNMINAKDKSEYEKWHCLHSNLQNIINLKNDDITNGIDYSILDEFVRISKYIYIYIWCSKEQIYDIMNFFIGKHHCNFNILCWCKQNCIPATNNCWLPNIEYCLVFKEKGGPRYNDGYNLKSKWYISTANKSDKDLYDHPTIKPLELVKKHILHSTQPNDVVLDPFIGSGTTALACKDTGRKYIGFEKSEKYYKIAIDRLNGIDKNGQTSLLDTDFDKLQEEHDLFKEGGK